MSRRGQPPKRTKSAVLDRRSATPGTPVHKWKQAFRDYQLYEGGLLMAAPRGASSPSARKLAASLWELHDLPLPACLPGSLYSPEWIPFNSPSAVAPPSDVNASPFSQPDYVLSPSSSKAATHRHVKTGAHRNGHTPLQRLLTKTAVNPSDDSAQAPMATLVDRRRHIPSPLFAPSGPREIDVTATTSQELLKLFSQIRKLEEQHNSSLSLTTALHSQLMDAHSRVSELEIPHRIARREMECLIKRFSEEKLSWKVKEKERLRAAVQSAKAESEEARKTAESANRRLTKDLTGAHAVAAKLLQELESERQARQRVEERCRDIARENDHHKAEGEEYKRQAQQVREELEEERRMLHMANVWREERVQMKLGEASLALGAALDDIRAELESFLESHSGGTTDDIATFRNAQALQKALGAVHCDTSIASSFMASTASTASAFPATHENMYATRVVDTDSSHGSRRSGGHALLFYPEGVPDAD